MQVKAPMWFKTTSSFMRVWQTGQATRPSSGGLLPSSVYSALLPSSAAPSKVAGWSCDCCVLLL